MVDGRARKTNGIRKPREEWNVLMRDNHPAYIISWQDCEEAASGKRAHEEELHAQVGARWPDVADRADAVWAVRPNDACLLQQGEG